MSTHRTDETPGKYVTAEDTADALEMLGKGYDQSQPAVIIERPRKAHGINDKGLEEFQLFGWVKMSAKFCARIRKLKGAKLSIWLCLALNIDENGECKLTQKEICALTDYSHTEVINSVEELSEMGLLSVDRSGIKNLYKPLFVAKGKGNNPIVKKLDSTPLDSVESSRAREKIVPSSSKKEQESKNNIDTAPDFRSLSIKDYGKVPELKTFMVATGWIPGSFVLETVYEFVRAGLTSEAIAKAFKEWTARGYQPGNVQGYLTWARDGIPPAYSAGRQSAKQTPAEPKGFQGIRDFLQMNGVTNE